MTTGWSPESLLSSGNDGSPEYGGLIPNDNKTVKPDNSCLAPVALCAKFSEIEDLESSTAPALHSADYHHIGEESSIISIDDLMPYELAVAEADLGWGVACAPVAVAEAAAPAVAPGPGAAAAVQRHGVPPTRFRLDDEDPPAAVGLQLHLAQSGLPQPC